MASTRGPAKPVSPVTGLLQWLQDVLDNGVQFVAPPFQFFRKHGLIGKHYGTNRPTQDACLVNGLVWYRLDSGSYRLQEMLAQKALKDVMGRPVAGIQPIKCGIQIISNRKQAAAMIQADHHVVRGLGEIRFQVSGPVGVAYPRIEHSQLGGLDGIPYRIGNNPISSYEGVEIEVSGDDGKLSLFPGNVDSASGGALTKTAGWVTRTSSIDATALAVEISGQLYYAGDAGLENRSVQVEMVYRKVGTATWLPFAYGTETRQYTHYWSAGHYESWPDSNGEYYQVWVQAAYGNNDPAQHVEGAFHSTSWDPNYPLFPVANTWRWRPYADVPRTSGPLNLPAAPTNTKDPCPPQTYTVQVPVVTLTNGTQKPLRRTWRINVAKGQYEVNIRRLTADDTDARAVSEIAWTQLRTYQPDAADYTGQKRVALKIKASGQLQGVVEQFSAIGSARVPVWKTTGGGKWVTEESSNPGWHLLAWYRGKKINGRRAFGACLPDSRIEVEAIKSFAAWCDLKKLTCNAVIDQAQSVAELANTICRCGRGSPTQATGRHGVIWDAPNQPSVMVFGMGNIVRNSFSVEYITGKLADEIIVNFWNPAKDWQQDQVRATVPGVTQPERPVTLDFFGCIDKDMAGREANLMAAEQHYHLRRVSWEADYEGTTCQRGDVVDMSHDLTQWGYSGRMAAGDGTTVTLDRKVPFTPGKQHYLQVIFPNGWFDVLEVATVEGSTDVLTLVDQWPTVDDRNVPLFTPNTDPDHPPCDYKYSFDCLATPGKKLKLVDVKPVSERRVRFIARDEEPEYYARETATYDYVAAPTHTRLASAVSDLAVTEQLLNASTGLTRCTITWRLENAAGVDLSWRINGGQAKSGRISGVEHSIDLVTGDRLTVSARPYAIGGLAGAESAALNYTVLGVNAPLPAVTGLSAVYRDRLTVVMFDHVIDVRTVSYEIRRGATWAGGVVVGTSTLNQFTADQDGTWWVAAKSGNVYGPASSIVITGAVLTANVVEAFDEAADGWTGTLTDGVAVIGGAVQMVGVGNILAHPDFLSEPNVLYYGGVPTEGYYTSPHVVDVGVAQVCNVTAGIQWVAVNVNNDFLSNPDILNEPNVLGIADGLAGAELEINVAQSDGVFTGWRKFTAGQIAGRKFSLRVRLWSADPYATPILTGIPWAVDMPDRDETWKVTTSAAGLVDVVFSPAFQAAPDKPQAMILDAQAGDTLVIPEANITAAGMKVGVKNGGAWVVRQVSGRVKSY